MLLGHRSNQVKHGIELGLLIPDLRGHWLKIRNLLRYGIELLLLS
jgi:hypothetical protein